MMTAGSCRAVPTFNEAGSPLETQNMEGSVLSLTPTLGRVLGAGRKPERGQLPYPEKWDCDRADQRRKA